MSKLVKNQMVIDGYLYHTDKSIKRSGAIVSKNPKKIKRFILEGKVPNGTNGVSVKAR